MMGLRGLLRTLWSLILISLVGLKHHDLTVKQLHDVIKGGVRALDNQSHIVSRFTMLNLGSLNIKVPLLVVLVKPPQKQSGAHGLLPIPTLTHIQQDVRILTEKLLDNAKHRIANLYIIGR